MRSFDWSMPEERNRVLTDHVSDLCLCSTPTAVAQPGARGARCPGARLVGDVMADVSLAMAPIAARESDVRERLGLAQSAYLVLTVHRAGNVDHEAPLAKLVELLRAAPDGRRFSRSIPAPARRSSALGALGELEALPHLRLVPAARLSRLHPAPVGRASAVLTDSGGVQKEAYLARVPCLTLRDSTEWTETVELGWNRLVGLDPDVVLAALDGLARPPRHPELYGGGHAGEAIVAALEEAVEAD